MTHLFTATRNDYYDAAEEFAATKGTDIETWTYVGEEPEDNMDKESGLFNHPYYPFFLYGQDAEYYVVNVDGVFEIHK